MIFVISGPWCYNNDEDKNDDNDNDNDDNDNDDNDDYNDEFNDPVCCDNDSDED